MSISLSTPDGAGIGTELLQAVICEADRVDVPVTLWSVKQRRKFFAEWGFYQDEPPVSPRDKPAQDAVYLRAEPGVQR